MDFTVSLALMPPTLPLSSFAACAGQQECSPPMRRVPFCTSGSHG